MLADGTRETFPNGNMADAHAEIGALQQAHEAGVSKGADINMVVSGKDVCGYCRGEFTSAANAAEVTRSLYKLSINNVTQ
ncbi:cytidine deaminase-like fold-containing protein [Yersinia enterocolitica]